MQEIAYAMSTAQAVLDAVRERVGPDTFPRVFGRISFFVNAGIRFGEIDPGLEISALVAALEGAAPPGPVAFAEVVCSLRRATAISPP